MWRIGGKQFKMLLMPILYVFQTGEFKDRAQKLKEGITMDSAGYNNFVGCIDEETKSMMSM